MAAHIGLASKNLPPLEERTDTMSSDHTLTPGTELVDDDGSRRTINVIHDDGSVDVTVVQSDGPARETETWASEEICDALEEGRLRTDDGAGSQFVEGR